jgi:hypothetical protein
MLEDVTTVDFGGHGVYATPKENLIMMNEDLDKLPPGTLGLGCLQAPIIATATQANRIDSSLPVGRGEIGGSRRPQRKRIHREGGEDLRDRLRARDARHTINRCAQER